MSMSQEKTPQFTLDQINERLAKHNLPRIERNQIDLIKQHASGADIQRAVADLGYVNEAKEFLAARLKSAGILQPPTQPSRGAPMGGATGGPRRPDRQSNSQSNAQSAPTSTHGNRPEQESSNRGSHPAQRTNVSSHPATRPPQRDERQNSSSSPQNSVPEQPQGLPVEDRQSCHVYARNNAALCFDADVAKSGFKTIAIDGAKAKGNHFDWPNKIRLQLTKGEVPEVLAVLLGHSMFCEFKNHGPSNNKGFSMERQGEKVYVKMFEKGKPLIGVPVHPQDLFYVFSLIMKRVLDENPWLDATSVLGMIRNTQPKKPVPVNNGVQQNSRAQNQ